MRWMLVCLTLLVAGPACADMTAVYENPAKSFHMKIELAANGDLRGEVAAKPGVYFLKVQGRCYFVVPSPTGLVVDRCEDTMAAVMAVANERTPGLAKLTEQAGKFKFDDKPFLTKGDEVTVQGRRGTAYYFALSPGEKSQPVLVISSDPDLAPLGAAMVTQSEMTASMSPTPMKNPLADEMTTILKTGAPVAIAGAELTTVSRDQIDRARFALPGPVESRDAIIKRLRSTTTGAYVQAF
jgi:hypothetical protein